jgi:signal peptidase I
MAVVKNAAREGAVSQRGAALSERLVTFAESFLTRRNAVRRIKKEKQRAKHPVIDWLEAFLWAAGWVLLVNQYLLQAYQIPSGSMIDTLLIGDRIIVNKIIFGPELLPGFGKLPGIAQPQRNEVVIFENPSYLSRGVAFDIAQRVIFMLTLSLVDIDRDENGEPKPHFLIKRAVGFPGDTFVNKRGDLLIRPAGSKDFIPEASFNQTQGYRHRVQRLMNPAGYPALEAAGGLSAFIDMGLTPPESLLRRAQDSSERYDWPDNLTYESAWLSYLHAAEPSNTRYRARLAQFRQGWYVPDGRLLPLGDNRDNSRDGRYFGAVRQSKVLGKGAVKFWPPGRIGVIR